jgi:DNA-binding MarR family transcriptional regulator
MTAKATGDVDGVRGRRRAVVAIKESMRELSVELSLFNRQVGSRLELKDGDLQCLDLLNRFGPLSPSVLARRAGQHPATMTGILDRLQRGGWVVRERDPEAADRRAVTVRALRDRNAELFGLLKGFNGKMDGICAEYTGPELEVIADFLRRTAHGAHDATEQLTGD